MCLYTGGCCILFVHGGELYIFYTQEGAMFHFDAERCYILFEHGRMLHICCAREGAIYDLYRGGCWVSFVQ